jgi:hypothetical protein
MEVQGVQDVIKDAGATGIPPRDSSPGDRQSKQVVPRRKAGKAKAPIVAPRTSLGTNFEVVLRKRPSEAPLGSAFVSASSKGQPQMERRTRGRSKRVIQSDTRSKLKPASPAKKTKGQPKRISAVESEPEHIIEGELDQMNHQEARSEHDEGFTWILMNPSPIKVSRHNTISHSGVTLGERPKHNDQLDGLSSDEEEARSHHGNGAKNSEQDGDRNVSRPELYSFTLDPPTLLDDLIETAQQVGYKQDRESKTYDRVRVISKLCTNTGKGFVTRLEYLSRAYEELQISMVQGIDLDIHKARANTSTPLERLSEYTHSTLDTKLIDGAADIGNHNDVDLKRILIDLYYIVLPKWLECIKLAIEACSEHGRMSLASLKEVSYLVRLYCDLADSATAQSSQPTAADIIPERVGSKKSRSLTFRIKQPTKDVLTKIHNLRQKLHREITTINRRARELQESSREQINIENEECLRSINDEEIRISYVERNRKRLTDEINKEQEKISRIKATHRQQHQDMERIRAETARLDAAWERRRSRYKHQVTSTNSSRNRYLNDEFDVDDENDPFSDSYQRLKGVFPSNNKRQTARVQWSDKDMERFILRMAKGAEGIYKSVPKIFP